MTEIGNKYGKLTVIEEVPERIKGRIYWKCQCECGNQINVSGTDLRTGRKTHCGCEGHDNKKNEIGNKYGKLTVIEEVKERGKDRSVQWLCQCECGNTKIVRGKDLRNGKIKSCGCYEQETRGQSLLTNEIGNKYGKLTVIDKIRPDNKTTYWKCQCECGNITYVYGPNLRSGVTKSCGCTRSYNNAKIKEFLEKNNINHKAEVAFSDLVTEKGGHPRFDFGIYNENNQLIGLIEYQGEQHYIDKGNFGQVQREYTDNLKKVYCLDKNIPLFEIRYDENVLEKLKQLLSYLFNDFKAE